MAGLSTIVRFIELVSGVRFQAKMQNPDTRNLTPETIFYPAMIYRE
jgi:hypothetical protein